MKDYIVEWHYYKGEDISFIPTDELLKSKHIIPLDIALSISAVNKDVITISVCDGEYELMCTLEYKSYSLHSKSIDLYLNVVEIL